MTEKCALLPEGLMQSENVSLLCGCESTWECLKGEVKDKPGTMYELSESVCKVEPVNCTYCYASGHTADSCPFERSATVAAQLVETMERYFKTKESLCAQDDTGGGSHSIDSKLFEVPDKTGEWVELTECQVLSENGTECSEVSGSHIANERKPDGMIVEKSGVALKLPPNQCCEVLGTPDSVCSENLVTNQMTEECLKGKVMRSLPNSVEGDVQTDNVSLAESVNTNDAKCVLDVNTECVPGCVSQDSVREVTNATRWQGASDVITLLSEVTQEYERGSLVPERKDLQKSMCVYSQTEMRVLDFFHAGEKSCLKGGVNGTCWCSEKLLPIPLTKHKVERLEIEIPLREGVSAGIARCFAPGSKHRGGICERGNGKYRYLVCFHQGIRVRTHGLEQRGKVCDKKACLSETCRLDGRYIAPRLRYWLL
ncbi:hypothetical protein XENTR_v10013926 [Xenopus tropicalis]|nr:hypothetical protein XENTR_v10013926 [Xenopus tropicalis]